MFKNAYQGGPFFEILSGHSIPSGRNWKMSGLVKRSYTQDIKGYSFLVQNGKLSIPGDSSTMILYQPFVVFQAYILSGADLSIEFATQDLMSRTKRFFLSTSIKEIKVTPLHVSLPLSLPKTSGWINLCFDLQSFLSKFSGSSFKSLVGISLHGTLKIRKIVTLKDRPMGSGEIEFNPVFLYRPVIPIPKALDLPMHIQTLTVVIDYSYVLETKPKIKSSVILKPSSPSTTAFGRSLPKSLSKVNEKGLGGKSFESLDKQAVSKLVKLELKEVSSTLASSNLPKFANAASGFTPSPSDAEDEEKGLESEEKISQMMQVVKELEESVSEIDEGEDIDVGYSKYIANRQAFENQSTSAVTLRDPEHIYLAEDGELGKDDGVCQGWETTMSPIQKSLESFRLYKKDDDEK